MEVGEPVDLRLTMRDVPMSDFYGLTMQSITGEEASFERFRGQVILAVNVASA